MRKKSLFSRLVCCAISAILFLSCATTKSSTSTVSVSQGDSLSAQSVQYAALSAQLSTYDSLFAQMQARITAQQSTSEQSHERIQESVTTYLDSLGREVRQESRTIDRDLARQTELRYEEQLSSLRQQLSTQTSRTDSLAAALWMLQQVNWLDSLNQQSVKEPAKSEGYFSHIKYCFYDMLIGLAVIALIFILALILKRYCKGIDIGMIV